MIKIPLDFKSIDFKNIDFKNTQTQRILAAGLIFLIVFVLYLYFVFVPQIVRVPKLFGKVGKITAELKSAKSTSAEMEGLKEKLAEYNEKVEWYEKKLPVEQEIPNLLEDLSDMAKGSNIKITSIMPAPAAPENNAQRQSKLYKEIPIRITARSGYHELGRFLSNLENSDRFMKVTNIGIKSNKTSPKQHDIELTVCTYILFKEK